MLFLAQSPVSEVRRQSAIIGVWLLALAAGYCDCYHRLSQESSLALIRALACSIASVSSRSGAAMSAQCVPPGMATTSVESLSSSSASNGQTMPPVCQGSLSP